MSVLAVSDLVFGDLLTELNLKPWWEKLRGYCFAASVVSALFMMYITLLSIPVDCIPLNARSVTIVRELSSARAKFINNYCSDQLPWYVTYAGLVSLSLCVIIVIVSSCWTLFPEVINSFRTFAHFGEIITKSNQTSEQLCAFSSEITKTKAAKECRSVRKACSLLWKYECQIYVWELYRKRNIYLLFLTIILTIYPAISLIFLLVDDDNFECFFHPKHDLIARANETGHHFCSFNTTKRLQPFMLTFTLSLLAQIAFIIPGFFKVRVVKNNRESLTEKGKLAARYSCFMVQFWKNSRPSSCGALEHLVEYIFSNGVDKMKLNLEKIIEYDFERIGIYSSLEITAEKEIFAAMKNMIKRDDFDLCSPLHDNIVRRIRFLKPNLTFTDFYEFVVYLSEQRYWELLASILVMNSSGWFTDLNKDNLRPIEINLNEIGRPYESERSFLFYVLSENLCNTPGFHAVINLVDPDKTYVHYDGTSVRTRTLYPASISETDLSVAEKLHEAKLLRIGNFTNEQMSSISRQVRTVVETSAYIPAGYRDEMMRGLASKIMRLKFDEWEKNIKEFANYANSINEWILLVALLNAFVVNDDSKYSLRDVGCPVKKFNVNEEQIKLEQPSDKPSILYYALKKTREQKKFHFTAVRHILNFNKGERKMVRHQNGCIEDAFAYVSASNELEQRLKDLLLDMLRESWLPPPNLPENGKVIEQGSNQARNEDNKPTLSQALNGGDGSAQNSDQALNKIKVPAQRSDKALNEGEKSAQGSNQALNVHLGSEQSSSQALNKHKLPTHGSDEALDEGVGTVQSSNFVSVQNSSQALNKNKPSAQGSNPALNESGVTARGTTRSLDEGDGPEQSPNKALNKVSEPTQGPNQALHEGKEQAPNQEVSIIQIDEDQPLLANK